LAVEIRSPEDTIASLFRNMSVDLLPGLSIQCRISSPDFLLNFRHGRTPSRWSRQHRGVPL
jgi:hypothetical protein